MPRDFYAEEIGGNVSTTPGRDYFAEEIGNNNQQQPPVQRTEQQISSRPDMLKGFAQGLSNPSGLDYVSPLPNLLRLIGGLGQRYESAISNPMIAAQQADPYQVQQHPFQFLGNLVNQSVQGITGQRKGEIGDLARNLGVGDTASGAIGLAGMLPFTGGTKALEGLASVGKAGVGLVNGGAEKIGEAVSSVGKNIGNVAKPVQLAKEVRNSMFGLKKQFGQSVDEGITTLSKANPNKVIDLSEPFYKIKEVVDDTANNPGLKGEINSIVRRVKNPEQAKLLKQLIDDPEKASELTLRQAEDMKRAISQSPTIQRSYAQGSFAKLSSGDMEILDLLDNVKLKQAEVFKELGNIRKPYAEFMSAYNQVKSSFKPASLENKMKNGFGTGEIEQLVKKVLPPETYKKIVGFRRAGKTIDWGAKAVGAGAVYEILRKAFTGKY